MFRGILRDYNGRMVETTPALPSRREAETWAREIMAEWGKRARYADIVREGPRQFLGRIPNPAAA